MHALRRSVLMGRLILAWFALTLGVAVAAPMVQPQAMALVCSAMGAIELVVVGQDGQHSAASHQTIECPMCLAVVLPPAHQSPRVEPVQPLAYTLQPIAAAHIAALVGAPLPPRGPPSLV